MTDLDALKDLDWQQVSCQCEQDGCKAAGGCDRPAAMRIAFHALDHCNEQASQGGELDPFGNYVLLFCEPCLNLLMSKTDSVLKALNRYGRKFCQSCGAPATEISDVVREISDL